MQFPENVKNDQFKLLELTVLKEQVKKKLESNKLLRGLFYSRNFDLSEEENHWCNS